MKEIIGKINNEEKKEREIIRNKIEIEKENETNDKNTQEVAVIEEDDNDDIDEFVDY